MSRYDGLIIPRSYSEYINKTDAATLLQALQLSGVMDNAPTANSNHPAKSGGIKSAIDSLAINSITAGETRPPTSGAVAGKYTPVGNNTLLQLNSGYSMIDGGIYVSGDLLIINAVIQRANTSTTDNELIGWFTKKPMGYFNSFVGVGNKYSITGVGYIFVATDGSVLVNFQGSTIVKINLTIPFTN